MASTTNGEVQGRCAAVTVAGPSASASTEIGYSASKAFSIPEIFEMILLELSIGDLFVQQRTCRLFKINIEGSLKVQQRMFLKASPVSGSFEDINPILGDLSLVFDHSRKGPIWCGTMVLNPDNKIEIGYQAYHGIIKFPSNWGDMVPDHLTIGNTSSSTPILRVNDPAASWRKMLPTRRIGATFSVVLTVQVQSILKMRYRKTFREGVVLGDILDKLDQQYDDLFKRSDNLERWSRSFLLERKDLDHSFMGDTTFQLGSSTENEFGVLTEDTMRTDVAAFLFS